MRSARYVLAAVAACLLMAGPAQAVERPITDLVVLHEIRMGVAWWNARGVYGCPNGPVASFAPMRELQTAAGTVEDVEGVGLVLGPHVGGCKFVLARRVYDIYRANRAFEELDRTCRRWREQFYCSDRITVRAMRYAQADRCSVVRHELGHAIGGLDDDETSSDAEVSDVMAQGTLLPVFDDCWALAVATWRFLRKPRPMRTIR